MPISREEALEQLRALETARDPEDAHYKADAVLLRLIGDLEIREAFGRVPKWYG